MDDPAQIPEAEHELISTSLDVEQLDLNLFRSKSLWVPSRARGVFGGQVISQALVSATKCVDPQFHAHSLHCYFLLSADASIPILYVVERSREGRSYVTRIVKAVQKGRAVFVLMASFSKIEPGQPTSQWPIPMKLKSPEDSYPETERLQKMADAESNPSMKLFFEQLKQDRIHSPIEVRSPGEGTISQDSSKVMYWMRARNIPKFEAPFQKCILAYISDLRFLSTVSRAIRGNPENLQPARIGMMSSLDHSLWFYDHEFDCREWVLFVMDSPRVGLGRGMVEGQFYTQSGKLIAVCAQEGVARGLTKKPVVAAEPIEVSNASTDRAKL